MDLNAEAPVQASLEVVKIVIGHAATRGCVSLRSTHSRRNTRCYPLPASPCVLGPRREWVERSETRNDWDRRTALGMLLLSVPICPPIDPIFGSGIAIMPPARIPGRLTSRRLISSARGAIFCQSDSHCPGSVARLPHTAG